MATKFIIVNNGLKDLRGHYFETAVSIAEAALALGLEPVLAAHVSCPKGIIPEWLEFFPIFCTDHWNAEPPAAAPDLRGIGGHFAAQQKVGIAQVLAKTASLDDFLAARFERFTEIDFERAVRKTRFKALLRAWVPGFLVPILRPIYKKRHIPLRWARRVLGLFPGKAADTAQAPTSTVASLQVCLERQGMASEWDFMRIFRRDLERLLCLVGATTQDHVFFPTAHGRELAAVSEIVREAGTELSPRFHLEFRHGVACAGDRDRTMDHYSFCHKLYFDWVRQAFAHERISLYTDTTELCADYGALADLPFRELPIPFRAELIQPRPPRIPETLCISYFGDARDEKGFHLLPQLIEALRHDYVAKGKVHFLVQDTLNAPKYNPHSQEAHRALRAMNPAEVRMVGGGKPLAPEEYYRLVSETDILLCPYERQRYRSCSSGTLTEGLAAGIPAVVPADSWLARQLPPGGGATFTDFTSLVQAVRSLCDHYASYFREAQQYKHAWLGVHSPANLVDELLSRGEPKPLARSA